MNLNTLKNKQKKSLDNLNIENTNMNIATIKTNIEDTTKWITNMLDIPAPEHKLNHFTIITINDIIIKNNQIPICNIYNNSLLNNKSNSETKKDRIKKEAAGKNKLNKLYTIEKHILDPITYWFSDIGKQITNSFNETNEESKLNDNQARQNKLVENKLEHNFKHLMNEYKNYCNDKNISIDNMSNYYLAHLYILLLD